MTIRHKLKNISKDVTITSDKGKQTIALELTDLPPLKKEPNSRPLRERLPMAYFAPEHYIYYGVEVVSMTGKALDCGNTHYCRAATPYPMP